MDNSFLEILLHSNKKNIQLLFSEKLIILLKITKYIKNFNDECKKIHGNLEKLSPVYLTLLKELSDLENQNRCIVFNSSTDMHTIERYEQETKNISKCLNFWLVLMKLESQRDYPEFIMNVHLSSLSKKLQ